MKIAIMQPYFLPYIGYFQLIGAADVFVVYDNIKYTKKGWINRNRIADRTREIGISLPLKSGADSLDVCERELAANFDRRKLLQIFLGVYSRAPQYAQAFELLEEIVSAETNNLFAYIHNSLRKICNFLEISTPIVVSSTVSIDHSLRGKNKVLAICQALGATHYINPIGGVELYDKAEFASHDIDLGFLQANEFVYARNGGAFFPWLSIVDFLMYNSPQTVARQLEEGFRIV